MVRIAECALQVRGTAGDRQVDGVERAVATGQGGATQFLDRVRTRQKPRSLGA
jgi:acetyl-CoA C-acetyltransferase